MFKNELLRDFPAGIVRAPAEEGGSPSQPSVPSGGAESPASSPAPVPPGTPASGGLADADGEDNSNSFSDILDGIDGLDLDDAPQAQPAPVSRAPAKTPAAPPAPATAQPPASPAPTVQQEVAPVAPAQQPQAQPSEPAQPASGTQPSGPPTLESALEGIQRDAGGLVEALATQMFALDAQTVEALQTDAVSAIPKLLARTFILAHASALKAMQEFVPQQIDSRTQGHRAADAAQQEFFTAYPGLRQERYAGDIINAIQILRARDPNMKRADVIRQVGTMVSVLHGVAPASGNGVAPSKTAAPPPFVPHVGGGVTQTPSAQDENPFAGLGFEFD